MPKKNLQKIAGRSLLRWAIEATLAAELPAYVSTEDSEISSEAVDCKATVIIRPQELASDEATSTEALYHAVKEIENLRKFNTIVFVEPNYFKPSAETIRTVMNAFHLGHMESAISVRQFDDTLWRIGADGYGVQMTNFTRLRRQDMEPNYIITGECMVLDKEEFMFTSEIPCGRVRLVPLSGETIDIHTPYDLRMAQHMLDSKQI